MQRANIDLTSVKNAKLPIFFIMGGPGSGKGTQCSQIVAQFKLTHLSSGDLLRAEVKSGSARAADLDKIMKSGELVPQEVVLDLIKEAMVKSVAAGSKGFLVDGYPREVKQGEQFEAEVGECAMAIFLDANEETLTKRLLERGKTSGRSDDNVDAIKARLKTFHTATEPVVKFYEEKGKLVRVNAEGSVDSVFAEVSRYIDGVINPPKSVTGTIAALIDIEPSTAKVPASGGKSIHTLKNLGMARVAFKIKTSNNNEYRVNPVSGYIESGKSAQLDVVRLKGKARVDKVVIQFVAVAVDLKGQALDAFKNVPNPNRIILTVTAA